MKFLSKRLALGALVVGLLSLDGCNPRPDPCPLSRQTSADFRVYSTLDYYEENNGKITPRSKIVEEDTFMVGSYIIFQALDTSAEVQSYEWLVGNDPRVRTGKKFTIYFNDENVADESPLSVQLVVHKKPDSGCFPNDNGVDTVTRQIVFLRYEQWPVLGTYYGSDNTDPNNKYTIEIFSQNKPVPPSLPSTIWIRNLPGGCNNVGDATIGGAGAAFNFEIGRFEGPPFNTFHNCYFREYDKKIGYLTPDRKGIVIEYEYTGRGQTDATKKKKVFTGIRQ